MVVGTNPALDANVSCSSRVLQYANKCLFNVFLDVCCQDYVEKIVENAKKKLVHEIYTHISDLQQSMKPPGGRNIMAPDVLYTVFIEIIVQLPEDASLWSITLCSTFLSVLSTNLRYKIE